MNWPDCGRYRLLEGTAEMKAHLSSACHDSAQRNVIHVGLALHMVCLQMILRKRFGKLHSINLFQLAVSTFKLFTSGRAIFGSLMLVDIKSG